MKRKIFGNLFLISLVVLVLTFVLTGLVYRASFDRQTREDLRQFAALAVSGSHGGRDISALEGLDSDVRITLIDAAGEVLFDSKTEEPLQNHSDRPEIAAAFETGEGHARRTSATLGYDTYYYARLLPDGLVLRAAIQTGTVYTAYDSAMLMVGAIFAVVLAVALVLSGVLTRSLVRPIEKMAENLDEIGESVPYPELEHFAENIKLQQDARNEAAALRRDFTANVTHELKTPLTSISGYAEMIETGLARAEDVPQFAKRIHTEAARLLNLIGDIIALSELDSLKSRQDFTSADLYEIAKTTCDYLSLSAQQSGVALTLQGEACPVWGSVSQLEELAYNLCDNAIRYNKPGGRVTISASNKDGCPVLSVSDTGIGIPEEHVGRIFERFYRVDKGRSKKTGGTGLGLAIVKHIALHHGAQLSVASAPGEGTEITVTFPKEGEI